MRTKKAVINTMTSIMAEVVSIICGLILPRLILGAFGSSYNGITSSITQFLSCIVLLRAGVGSVTRAALYNPLSQKNKSEISGIVNATAIFMKKVALIYVGALIVFACVYPFLVRNSFSWIFSATLVLIIGSSTFVDNYFGIAYQMLLQADQKNYVNTIPQIVTTILNTIVAAVLIHCGAGIHLVKLGSAIIYFIRPLFLSYYVKKKYEIDADIKPNNSAISQRWDAFAQQAAAFVNNNTDVIVLTMFSDIKEVSVYIVYYMVANGLYKVEQTFTDGIEAAFGNMLAKKENRVLQENFRVVEYLVFTSAAFLFICGAALIVPFAEVYTLGISDVSYKRPLFGMLMCLNQFLFCVRLPYHMLVDAAGHFKQTRNGAIFEAFLNVIVSVTLVIKFGLIGVTIGTFCALLFRTLQYSIYASKNILQRKYRFVAEHIALSIVQAVIVSLVLKLIYVPIFDSYINWILYAIEVAIVVVIVLIISSAIFYKQELRILRRKAKVFWERRSKAN